MKKGFTLVELLAVIVILGVIAIIVIPKIKDALFKSQDEAYNMLLVSIENKANDYAMDNNIPSSITQGSPVTVTLQQLVDSDYLEVKDLVDPRTSRDIDLTLSYVTFSSLNGNLVYDSHIVTLE
jgi:prepilin-type N-terminal cleavage/methylation domain-containing protein